MDGLVVCSTLELIAGIVGLKKRVPRKMLEIVKIQGKTDEEDV